jgi:hypothetical protein
MPTTPDPTDTIGGVYSVPSCRCFPPRYMPMTSMRLCRITGSWPETRQPGTEHMRVPHRRAYVRPVGVRPHRPSSAVSRVLTTHHL